MKRVLERCSGAALLLVLSACTGEQSALVSRGREASEIGSLFWIATAVSAAVTILVIIAIMFALWGPPTWKDLLSRERAVLLGGIVLPVLVLTYLLVQGSTLLQAGVARTQRSGEPSITIVGKRWWWEVIYHLPNGETVASANELRLPVGRPISVRLETADVIHSFWAPQLGGKLDMIPGRSNVITLEATEPGTSRGQCAEYCGGAHALMAFYVVALPPKDYRAWLSREAADARTPQTEQERLGERLFMTSGCGACHTVRGTEARGVIAPDLTHVGSRRSLAAATLPNDEEAFARWIAENQHIKPENLMPEFDVFTPQQLEALSAYLSSLK
ncbi:cytochrome c oxidase subunit II [Chelativorans xinjiangense]|uniref:cytochrome c oxidase subunit II n=1 Tax=Chelativorans xinjiangense TaxID=2681485 RepID=UPI00135AA5B6|nr:c-type cytochrome [Chelativorans xinjiangense]